MFSTNWVGHRLCERGSGGKMATTFEQLSVAARRAGLVAAGAKIMNGWRLSGPRITLSDIAKQFWIDIAGKEVSSPETYSHGWVDLQFGHVCLGLLLAMLLDFVLGSGLSKCLAWCLGWFGLQLGWEVILPFPWEVITSTLLAVVVVGYWEWRAFNIAIKGVTGRFRLDRSLLCDNAVTAALYMALGATIVFVYRYFTLTHGTSLGFPNAVCGIVLYVVLGLFGVWL